MLGISPTGILTNGGHIRCCSMFTPPSNHIMQIYPNSYLPFRGFKAQTHSDIILELPKPHDMLCI